MKGEGPVLEEVEEHQERDGWMDRGRASPRFLLFIAEPHIDLPGIFRYDSMLLDMP